MKVLHLVPNLNWGGGIETYLLSMLPDLESEGHPQVVAYAHGNPALVPKAFQIPSLGNMSRKAERACRDAIRRLIADEAPEVVHLHNVNNLGAVEACIASVPTFFTAHGYHAICPATDFYQERTEEICKRSCGLGCFLVTLRKKCLTPRPHFALQFYRRSRWMMKHAAAFAGVIAPSTYTAERYLEAGFPRERVSVLPYFCPVNPSDAPPELVHPPTLLFLGRIRPYKGYRYFVEALGLLPPPIRGLMVGDFTAKLRWKVERLASASGCAGRLELRSWVDRDAVPGLMRRAAVFVFPSIWPETLGIVGLEAMACGVPVVASDVGGVREWLRDGENGVLVPPKDSRALAAGVQSILASNDRREAMGRNAIRTVRERFSPATHRAELLSLYERACRTASREVS